MRRGKDELPADVERVRGRLMEWRGERRLGQRIPEEVWAESVRAAGRYGIRYVSEALELDYGRLERRCGQPEQGDAGGQVAFVELAATRPEAVQCVVEVEKSNGTKLRVSVGDAATVDWCRVKEAFLGA